MKACRDYQHRLSRSSPDRQRQPACRLRGLQNNAKRYQARLAVRGIRYTSLSGSSVELSMRRNLVGTPRRLQPHIAGSPRWRNRRRASIDHRLRSADFADHRQKRTVGPGNEVARDHHTCAEVCCPFRNRPSLARFIATAGQACRPGLQRPARGQANPLRMSRKRPAASRRIGLFEAPDRAVVIKQNASALATA